MKANELEVVNIRLVPDRTFFSEKPIRSPQDAVSFIAEHLSDYDREVLAVLNLNTKGKVLNMNFVSVGTINASLVEPREFFKSTILSNAAGVIMIHLCNASHKECYV
jgi:DNA repair protein RadC